MSAAKKTSARNRTPTHKQQYEVLWLKYQVDVLLGIPPGSNFPPKMPMRDMWISDMDRSKIARYLRAIADNPDILEKLTRVPKPPARRGRPAESERNHRVGLDYMLTYERLKKSEAATKEMWSHWNIKHSTIVEIYQKCQTDRSWVIWAQFTMRRAKANGESLQEVSRRIRQSGNST